jgi:hypothetical protein
MTAIAPPRTVEQRRAALAIANHVRVTNAVTLKTIKAMPRADGLRAVVAVLRGDTAGPQGAITIRALLTAPTYMHARKAQAMLWEAEIYQHRFVKEPPVRSLSVPQRFRLAAVVENAAAVVARTGRMP